jgi:hypothetical protein
MFTVWLAACMIVITGPVDCVIGTFEAEGQEEQAKIDKVCERTPDLLSYKEGSSVFKLHHCVKGEFTEEQMLDYARNVAEHLKGKNK